MFELEDTSRGVTLTILKFKGMAEICLPAHGKSFIVENTPTMSITKILEEIIFKNINVFHT